MGSNLPHLLNFPQADKKIKKCTFKCFKKKPVILCKLVCSCVVLRLFALHTKLKRELWCKETREGGSDKHKYSSCGWEMKAAERSEAEHIINHATSLYLRHFEGVDHETYTRTNNEKCKHVFLQSYEGSDQVLRWRFDSLRFINSLYSNFSLLQAHRVLPRTAQCFTELCNS